MMVAGARYDRHYRVEHGDDEFANSANHINGIESFASLSPIVLRNLMQKMYFLAVSLQK